MGVQGLEKDPCTCQSGGFCLLGDRAETDTTHAQEEYALCTLVLGSGARSDERQGLILFVFLFLFGRTATARSNVLFAEYSFSHKRLKGCYFLCNKRRLLSRSKVKEKNFVIKGGVGRGSFTISTRETEWTNPFIVVDSVPELTSQSSRYGDTYVVLVHPGGPPHKPPGISTC